MIDNDKTKTKNKTNELTKIRPHEPCNRASHTKKMQSCKHAKQYLKGDLSGPRVVPNGPSVPKNYLKNE